MQGATTRKRICSPERDTLAGVAALELVSGADLTAGNSATATARRKEDSCTQKNGKLQSYAILTFSVSSSVSNGFWIFFCPLYAYQITVAEV